MLPSWFTSRILFLGVFATCAAMMGFGYWLQYALGLEPCPLCMTQRVFIVAVGLTGLIAALHDPARLGIRIYATVMALLCVAGGSFSARHVWLQSLPLDQVPACGPSIDYILDTFPIMEALEILLRGNGNCAIVDWSFMGVSIPGWTLVAFAGLLALSAWTLLQPQTRT
jgi:disulfide bond formation protein DsbB